MLCVFFCFQCDLVEDVVRVCVCVCLNDLVEDCFAEGVLTVDGFHCLIKGTCHK